MPNFSHDQIKSIADDLDIGFNVYYQKETGEIISVPDTLQFPDFDDSLFEDELEKLENDFSSYRQIYRMESRDSFQVMEEFAEQVKDSRLQDRLFRALNQKHPFRVFKYEIDDAGDYRQKWFDFKLKQLCNWVKNQIDEYNDSDK